MNYTNIFKPFKDLTVAELYEVLRLRSEIFVVEQNCVFLDMDNKDQLCNHLLLYANSELVAYARIVPPGLSFEEASIGRVITGRVARGTGAGKLLMQQAIEECKRIFPSHSIRIGAQLYATKFYERVGFKADGEVYDEDGIDHIEMILE